MRFYVPTIATPPVIVDALGSQFAIASVIAKRRDAGNTQIQFFDSFAAPVGIELDGTPEIAFGGKESSDWNGPAVVLGQSFAWNATLKLYEAGVSFNTHGLTALFVSMVDHVVITADTTLDATHLSQLVVVDSASSKTIKVGASLGSAAETMVVQRAGTGAVVLQGDTGVTVTAGTGVTLSALAANQCIKLTRTGSNAWTATIASEVASVTLMAEITWRDAGVANSDQSTKTFELVIENDVIRRDESAPTDANAPTIYPTKAELSAEVTSQIEAQIGVPLGAMIPGDDGATLRGDAETIDVLTVLVNNFPLTVETDIFTGTDLQQDVITVEGGSLTAFAMLDFIIEGTRSEPDNSEIGGYRNAITLDTVELFTMQRAHVSAFAGHVLAYTITGQIAFSKVGATGRAHIVWEMRETDGTTERVYSSRAFAPSSTDTTAQAIDTTVDFDLGIAAVYLAEEAQVDHSIRLATIRRKV